jgi:hypothetical protein
MVTETLLRIHFKGTCDRFEKFDQFMDRNKQITLLNQCKLAFSGSKSPIQLVRQSL